jgi:hypothetical protein
MHLRVASPNFDPTSVTHTHIPEHGPKCPLYDKDPELEPDFEGNVNLVTTEVTGICLGESALYPRGCDLAPTSPTTVGEVGARATSRKCLKFQLCLESFEAYSSG